MSQILEEVHSSVTGDIKHHTLELPHSTFANGVMRWVLGNEDETLGLESGQQVGFDHMLFGISLPDRSLRGNQTLQFQLDNITGESLVLIRKVIDSGEKLPVIYRPYLESNKAYPAKAAIAMMANAFSADKKSVVVVADFHDFVNKLWPLLRYTPVNSPGLKYL